MDDFHDLSLERDESDNFSQVWNSYVRFEKFYRHKGEKLSDFLGKWKSSMTNAQLAGCQYSDTFLACKLLEKSNLENDDIHSIINSIGNSRSEVLSLLLARLEAFSPEVAESEENHRSHKDENGVEVKKEELEKFFPSLGLPQKELSLINELGDDLENSRCPNCDTELDLITFDGPGGKRHRLVCKPFVEIKEEIPDNSQSSLDFDLDDLMDDDLMLDVVKEKKPRKRKSKPKIEADKDDEENVNDDDILDDVEPQEKPVKKQRIKAEGGKKDKLAKKPRKPGRWSCQCEFCGTKFSPTQIQKHYENCQSRLMADEPLPEGGLRKKIPRRERLEKLQCEFCGKECPKLRRLKEHYARCPNLDPEQREAKGYKIKNEKATCNICGKVLHREYNLKLHMTLHGEKNYKCDLCPAAFTHSSFLVSHMKRHEEKKRFDCTECPKFFTCVIGLKRHVMREHTNERPFQCDQCSYSTVNGGHLSRHMRSHTGERPFKCSFCGKLYRDKKSLKRHMKAHYGPGEMNGLNELSIVPVAQLKLKEENQVAAFL